MEPAGWSCTPVSRVRGEGIQAEVLKQAMWLVEIRLAQLPELC
jgi:hypothetical protein